MLHGAACLRFDQIDHGGDCRIGRRSRCQRDPPRRLDRPGRPVQIDSRQRALRHVTQCRRRTACSALTCSGAPTSGKTSIDRSILTAGSSAGSEAAPGAIVMVIPCFVSRNARFHTMSDRPKPSTSFFSDGSGIGTCSGPPISATSYPMLSSTRKGARPSVARHTHDSAEQVSPRSSRITGPAAARRSWVISVNSRGSSASSPARWAVASRVTVVATRPSIRVCAFPERRPCPLFDPMCQTARKSCCARKPVLPTAAFRAPC